jgi:hypothetical protein
LEDNKELLYQTAYQNSTKYGHCIYVAFHRVDNKIIIRVDNLWNTDICNKHAVSSNKTKKTKEPLDKYYPYLIAEININEVETLQGYVLQLFKVKDLPSRLALPIIYQDYEQPQTNIKKYGFPDMGAQKVDNCIVKNFSIGAQYRLGKEIYKLFHTEEEVLVTRLKPKHIPPQPTQNSVSQTLRLRGGNLLTHEELMQKIAECLKIDYSNVYNVIVVEQTLVNMAGISTAQTNTKCTCTRNFDGSTYFILYLTNLDRKQFEGYYNDKFPGFIKIFRR